MKTMRNIWTLVLMTSILSINAQCVWIINKNAELCKFIPNEIEEIDIVEPEESTDLQAGENYMVSVITTNSEEPITMPVGEISVIGCMTIEASSEFENAVDLGLPSGTKWSNHNIGAINPEDQGCYFAWGEIVPHGGTDLRNYHNYVYNYSYYDKPGYDLRRMDMETYLFSNGRNFNSLTKYNPGTSSSHAVSDGLSELQVQDDAAYRLWGSNWRMPSSDQVKELITNCTTEKAVIGGIEGCYFISKINGNKIFIPAVGLISGNLLEPNNLGTGYYWTRDVYSHVDAAKILWFTAGGLTSYSSGTEKWEGLPIRPVYEPTKGIVMSQQAFTLKQGQTADLSVSGDITSSLVWSSDKPEIAEVDQKGHITVKELGTATISVKTDDNRYTASCPVWVIPDNSKTVNGHQAVDMVLSSATLWAATNVGAEQPIDYGCHYAWGELEEKQDYTQDNYQFNAGDEYTWKLTKYNNREEDGFVDDFVTLQPNDDVATVMWGSQWWMPSHLQQSELVKECNWHYYVMPDGRSYYKVISKIDDNYILIPNAGEAQKDGVVGSTGMGYYWSRDTSHAYAEGAYQNCSTFAYTLWISVGTPEAGYPMTVLGANYYSERHRGLSVRPVVKE